MKFFLIILIYLIFCIFLPSQTSADVEQVQEYLKSKTQTIKIIVPFNVGGRSDFLARVLAVELEQNLGMNVAIINIAGKKGWTEASRAKPDGCTLSIYNRNLPLSADDGPSLKDFEPIAIFAFHEREYGFYGLLAPKNTGKDIITHFENATEKAVHRKNFITNLEKMKLGMKAYFVNSDNFLATIKGWLKR